MRERVAAARLANVPSARRHETFNPTEEERIILNIDVFHPELTDLECQAIQFTIALKKKLFGSTEEEVHESRR